MTTITARGAEIAVSLTITLVTEECCNCGVLFGMTKEHQKQRRDDKQLFYCPNGHGQMYMGKSKDEQLREAREARQRAEDAAYTSERKLEDERRKRKRIETRAKNGVCPLGCKRTFANVKRHIETKHPEQAGTVRGTS